MRKRTRLLAMALAIPLTGMLGGCATVQREPRSLYDLGLLPAAQSAPAPSSLPALAVAEVDTPPWLDSRLMFYRLAYANDQQPHPYANSRWSASPAQLLEQRLKARLGQAGGAVVSASDGVTNVPVLRIEVDDFSQVFTAPQQSHVRMNLRASVLKGRALAAHRTFMKELPAPTADAAGGVKALADASDAIITEMIDWLAALPLKK
jgi:cholesterol transport system auxiliary component